MFLIHRNKKIFWALFIHIINNLFIHVIVLNNWKKSSKVSCFCIIIELHLFVGGLVNSVC